MNLLKFYLRDAREGIQRNAGAALAAVILVFISLSISGMLFLLKSGMEDVIDFLHSQVKIKVFVDPNVNVQQVAEILKVKSFVQSVEVETKEETLDRLASFFKEKEHLFEAFREEEIPNSIEVELTNTDEIERVAAELSNIQGITDVIYAQEFAQMILTWVRTFNHYGIGVLAIFLVASFLTVSIAINLALYQRQKEIRVKLLLGAKESHVRGQFLFEGLLLGLIGSILASFTVYLIYHYLLYQLQVKFGFIFTFTPFMIHTTMLVVIIGGALIGLIGSYLATRKMMKHA